MRESRVGVLVTSLTSPRSRRAVLGLLGGSLGAVDLREAPAKKRKKKRFCKCALGHHCERGKCIPDVPTVPPVTS